jgi:hypothetical protein
LWAAGSRVRAAPNYLKTLIRETCIMTQVATELWEVLERVLVSQPGACVLISGLPAARQRSFPFSMPGEARLHGGRPARCGWRM